MNKKKILIVVLFLATIWQPTHHYLMSAGMSMNSELHNLVTMCPFFTVMLIMMKSFLR